MGISDSGVVSESLRKPTVHERLVALLLAGTMAMMPMAMPAVAMADDGDTPAASEQSIHRASANHEFFGMSRHEMCQTMLRYYRALGADEDSLSILARHYSAMSKGDPVVGDFAGLIYKFSSYASGSECSEDFSKLSDDEQFEFSSRLDSLSETYQALSMSVEEYHYGADSYGEDVVYKAFADPTLLNQVNADLNRLYELCNKMGVLDKKLMPFISEVEEKTGSDLASDWAEYKEGDPVYEGMFDGIDELDPDATYYVVHSDYSNWYRVLTSKPTFDTSSVYVRDLFAVDTLIDNEPYVGFDSGTGKTDLTVIAKSVREYGGTSEKPYIDKNGEPTDEVEDPETDEPNRPNPLYNPDADEDGLGDNLAFTVPSSINYVARGDGSLIAPTNAYIENRSSLQAHVSSLKVTPIDGWNFVKNVTSRGAANQVELYLASDGDELGAIDYVNRKVPIITPSHWSMAAHDGVWGSGDDVVNLDTRGKVSNLTTDINTRQKFGEVRWYMMGGSGDTFTGVAPTANTNALYDMDMASRMMDTDYFNAQVVTPLEEKGYEPSDNDNAPVSIAGRSYAVVAPSFGAQVGDWLTLHMSDGSRCEIVVAGVMSRVSGLADGVTVSEAGVSIAGVDGVAPIGFYGELYEGNTVGNYSRVGHGSATLMSVENHGNLVAALS